MPTFTINTDSPYPGVRFVWPKQPESPSPVIKIGENVTFRPPCIIYWGVSIGDNCAISHNSVIRENTTLGYNTKIGNGTTLDGNLTIGNNVSIHTLCFVPSETIVEDNVFLGPGCTVTNTKRITHGRDFPLIEEGPHIKFGARIGGGTTICPDITIGKEAFIGAGSVVTKDIPDYKLAYGSPARVIKDIPPDEYYSSEDS